MRELNGVQRSGGGISSRSTAFRLPEIELLAGIFPGFLVIGLGGGELGGMSAEVEIFAIQVNRSHPLLLSSVEAHTRIP